MLVQRIVCEETHLSVPHRRSDERLDLQWSLEGHQLGVVSVDISHTLPIAASSSLDAHIRLWDLENGKQIKSIDAGPGKTLREGNLSLSLSRPLGTEVRQVRSVWLRGNVVHGLCVRYCLW